MDAQSEENVKLGSLDSETRSGRLTEAEIHQYVAQDAPLTTTNPWELVVTSRKLKIWAWVSAAIVLGLHIFWRLWLQLGIPAPLSH